MSDLNVGTQILVDCLWQSTICLVVGMALSYLWRRHPARAHRVLLFLVVACAIAPLLSHVVRDNGWGVLPVSEAPKESRTEILSPVSAALIPGSISAALDTNQAMLPQVPPATPVTASPVVETPRRAFPISPYGLPIWAWSLVSGALFVRLLLSLRQGFLLVGRARSLEDERILLAAENARSRLDIEAIPKLRISSEVCCPLIWCWGRRPAIVLPETVAQSNGRIDWVGVLCHELGHWKRSDHVASLVVELAICVLPWQPLLWWARRRLAHLSERACDLWVVASGESRTSFAESLIQLLPQRTPVSALPAVSNTHSLRRRVRYLLSEASHDPHSGRCWNCALVAVVLSLVSMMALAQQQEETNATDGGGERMLLRFSPEVGTTYRYELSNSRDTTFRGRTSSFAFDAIFSMNILAKEDAGYRTKVTFEMGEHNLGESSEAFMKEKAAEVHKFNVTDRYVFDREGQMNLCFPDDPVGVGSEWEGFCHFKPLGVPLEDLPLVKTSYKLVDVAQTDEGKICTIESRPLTKEIELPLQLGYLGLDYDDDLRVTDVAPDSGADGNVQVGDVLTSLNGHKAQTPKEFNLLKERYVEPADALNNNVTLTLTRGEEEVVVEATKTLFTLGTLTVEVEDAVRKTLFDVDRGLVVSEEDEGEQRQVYNITGDRGSLGRPSRTDGGAEGKKPHKVTKTFRYLATLSLVQDASAQTSTGGANEGSVIELGTDEDTKRDEIRVGLPGLEDGAKPLDMVLIPAGTFTMGAATGEDGSRPHWAWPPHEVTITKPFYMAKYELTRAQWKTVMGKDAWFSKHVSSGPNRPVGRMSWGKCQDFIEDLNELGLGTFRFPTEAEWEYACRAGTTTRFSFGDTMDEADKYIWWKENDKTKGAEPVGLKLPNPWGLYDMHGNVGEWCSDRLEKAKQRGPQTDPRGPSPDSFVWPLTDKVNRGGSSYHGYGSDCSSAARYYEQASDSHYLLGFRLVREVP